jgi:hypothetical protein
MTDFEADFVKDWEKTRRRGFGRFVVTRGSDYGVFLALFILVGEWLDGRELDPLRILAVLAACFAVGCMFAPLAWYNREARYRHFIERSSDVRTEP